MFKLTHNPHNVEYICIKQFIYLIMPMSLTDSWLRLVESLAMPLNALNILSSLSVYKDEGAIIRMCSAKCVTIEWKYVMLYSLKIDFGERLMDSK